MLWSPAAPGAWLCYNTALILLWSFAHMSILCVTVSVPLGKKHVSVSRVWHISCGHIAVMKIHMVKDLVKLSTRSTHSKHFIDSDCMVSWETSNKLNDWNEKTVRKFQIKYSKSLRRVLNKWTETYLFSRGPSQCSIFTVKMYPHEWKCWCKKQHGLIKNKNAECKKPGIREKMVLSFHLYKTPENEN